MNRFILLIALGLTAGTVYGSVTYYAQVAGNGSCGVNLSSSSPVTQTLAPCNYTANTSTTFGVFSGSAYTNFFQLGATGSVQDNGNLGPGPMDLTTGGYFYDSALYLSNASASGNLQFKFSIDGTVSLGVVTGQSQVSPSWGIALNGQFIAKGSDSLVACNVGNCGANGTGPVSLNYSNSLASSSVAIAPGQQFSLQFSFDLETYMYGLGTTSADFSHTFQLTEVSFTDSNGNPIGGTSLVDAAGNSIPLNQNLLATPEPSCLFSGGLLVLSYAVYRRRSTSAVGARRGERS